MLVERFAEIQVASFSWLTAYARRHNQQVFFTCSKERDDHG